MKSNLFRFASKELSQDAFIAWLIDYSNPLYTESDIDLKECSNKFITGLIKLKYPEFDEEIVSINIDLQWEKIDIAVEVNKKYLLIIEDKVNSGQHSNQLERYYKIASKWCIENSYKEPICIYLKTGNDSNKRLRIAESFGYFIFNRNNFLDLLNEYKYIKNDILIDFRLWLYSIENATNNWTNKTIFELKSNDWIGILKSLDGKSILEDWHFVNNPSGGFWGGVLTWHNLILKGFNYPVYLQIEESLLCVKVCDDADEIDVSENITRAEIREEVWNKIAKSKLFSEIMVRPEKSRDGNYMTIAKINSLKWLGNGSEKINLDNIASFLTKLDNELKTILQNE